MNHSSTRRSPDQQQKLKAYARELRSLQTDAESRLWHLLRDRRFFGHKFRRQHAVDNFILDFYCPEQHLAIELDGGQHNDQQGYDQARERSLARLGIRVLRFWNHDVLQQTEAVLEAIFDALEQTAAAPHPACGERGRGEGKSLRDQALACLGRREHTRLELATKLRLAGYPDADIEPLLDDFSQRGWLSNERFAENYVQQKQQRFGSLKLAHELRSRGLDESTVQQALSSAKETELERAREVWKKRFGQPPADAREKARQMRFLQGRGFSVEVILNVLACQAD
ncbi:MAG: recombination regulator RecX [Thiobacillaceae bacterium]